MEVIEWKVSNMRSHNLEDSLEVLDNAWAFVLGFLIGALQALGRVIEWAILKHWHVF